jgi:hypothetical protein
MGDDGLNGEASGRITYGQGLRLDGGVSGKLLKAAD